MFLYLVVKVKTFEYHSKSINQDFIGQKKKKKFRENFNIKHFPIYKKKKKKFLDRYIMTHEP